jgi:hypothetical protein
MTTLPTVTLDQCEDHTGLTANHAAHTLYTATSDQWLNCGTRYVPFAQCLGRHEDIAVPAVSADPFALIPGAHDLDL